MVFLETRYVTYIHPVSLCVCVGLCIMSFMIDLLIMYIITQLKLLILYERQDFVSILLKFLDPNWLIKLQLK